MKTAGKNNKTTSGRVALYGLLIALAFVTKTFGVFFYLSVLLIAGTAAGALIGLLGGLILKRISRIFY